MTLVKLSPLHRKRFLFYHVIGFYFTVALVRIIHFQLYRSLDCMTHGFLNAIGALLELICEMLSFYGNSHNLTYNMPRSLNHQLYETNKFNQIN